MTEQPKTSSPDTTLVRERDFLQRCALFYTRKAGFPVSFVVTMGVGDEFKAPAVEVILHRPATEQYQHHRHIMRASTKEAFLDELNSLLKTTTKDNHREQLLN